MAAGWRCGQRGQEKTGRVEWLEKRAPKVMLRVFPNLHAELQDFVSGKKTTTVLVGNKTCFSLCLWILRATEDIWSN